MLLSNIIKKVPLYNKEELLLYIVENSIEVLLKITTHSGNIFKGYVLNITEVKDEGTVTVIQLIDQNNILHLALKNIESIVFYNSDNIINILSKGKIKSPKTYEVSNKLDVKRNFKKFHENIFDKTNVSVGIPLIKLPNNGKQLNRIYTLTKKIEESLTLLLQQEDAKESWTSKFTKIAFVDHSSLKVSCNNAILKIYFPFTNLDSPEISNTDLNTQILNLL